MMVNGSRRHTAARPAFSSLRARAGQQGESGCRSLFRTNTVEGIFSLDKAFKL